MKHDGYEAIRRLIEETEPSAASLEEYVGTFRIADRPRAKELFDTYIPDPRVLLQDLLRRPDHYTPRQAEIIRFLAQGVRAKPPTSNEKNTLLITFTARSAPKPEQPKQVSRKEEIIMEDGKPLEDAIFEEQNFAKGIDI